MKISISIHALLAESDSASLNTQQRYLAFLSTLSLRRATTGNASGIHTHWISIHALLAESDLFLRSGPMTRRYFYPRSPCGERLLTLSGVSIDCQFLSTLSLRRATVLYSVNRCTTRISIHALLAESDQLRWCPRLRPR